mgnify:FL=1
MALEAHKLSGLGNIIVIVDLIRQEGDIQREQILKVVSEGQVNFDQLITIEPPEDPALHLKAKIFNTDGSEAKNCINGARCLAKYVIDSGLLAQKEFSVSTLGGVWHLSEAANECYSAKISPPNFTLGKENLPEADSENLISLKAAGTDIDVYFVNLGNPHAVCFVEDIKNYPLVEIGSELQTSSWFPDGINFGIAKTLSSEALELRVYERGVGETLACGSGACAAVVAGNEMNLLKKNVEVIFKEGSLKVEYSKENGELFAVGPANYMNQLSLEI